MVDFILINTLPNSGVDVTPTLVSKEPDSPPNTEQPCVFAKSCLTSVL